MVRRRRLHAYAAGSDAKAAGEPRPHRRDLRTDAWSLGNNRRIDVDDGETGSPDTSCDLDQERDAVGAAPAFVAAGEMGADVAECGGAEKCVDNGMGKD